MPIMDRRLNDDLSNIAGLKFSCSCGKEHSVDIRRIEVSQDIDAALLEEAHRMGGKILLVSDLNTFRVKGEAVSTLLSKEKLCFKSFVFETDHLVPTEQKLGRLLLEVDGDTSLIIAVGSGSMNDLARMVSSKMRIPYMIVATAPSMDGYASTVSPLIVEGFKTTYEAVYPMAILGDLNVIKAAPPEMITAGFGDILGKFTALTDWALARKVNGEYYCEETVGLMKKAIQKCVDHVEAIAARDEASIKFLMDALILSGVAMGMVGNSRPASGAEHHLAHFWEMDALKRKVPHALHGNMVGVGTVVIAYLYQWVDPIQPLDLELPDPVRIKSLLKKMGAPLSPKDLGIPEEVFTKSVIKAKEIRPRYTVLHVAQKLGILEEAAQRLTNLFYRQMN